MWLTIHDVNCSILRNVLLFVSTEPMNKNMSQSQMSFGGGLSSGPAPSQQFVFYDPTTSALGQLFQPHSQLIGGNQPSQNLGSSQIIGSQLMQTR